MQYNASQVKLAVPALSEANIHRAHSCLEDMYLRQGLDHACCVERSPELRGCLFCGELITPESGVECSVRVNWVTRRLHLPYTTNDDSTHEVRALRYIWLQSGHTQVSLRWRDVTRELRVLYCNGVTLRLH